MGSKQLPLAVVKQLQDRTFTHHWPSRQLQTHWVEEKLSYKEPSCGALGICSAQAVTVVVHKEPPRSPAAPCRLTSAPRIHLPILGLFLPYSKSRTIFKVKGGYILKLMADTPARTGDKILFLNKSIFWFSLGPCSCAHWAYNTQGKISTSHQCAAAMLCPLLPAPVRILKNELFVFNSRSSECLNKGIIFISYFTFQFSSLESMK